MESCVEKSNKKQDFIFVLVMAILLFGLSIWCWCKKEADISTSERRLLQKFPEFSIETVMNGQFMEEFEAYCLDQFPAREWFRSLKAFTKYGVLIQKDNNGIYYKEGHLSKIEYPMNQPMLDHAVERINYIYKTYLKEQKSQCYMAIVPDKNYYLAKENGYLSIDYDALFSYMEEQLDYMQFIDLLPFLDLSDYYRTDTHWKQECILDIAQCLKEEMRVSKEIEVESKINMTEEEIEEAAESNLNHYQLNSLEAPFYGVYYGQAALPVKPDTLYYLTNEALEQCIVTSYDTGKPKETVIYNMEKAKGMDAYEIFLSGTSALQVIENPGIQEEKELIVFRDSFGSSLIPLLVDEYSKITVIDIRYVQSDMLGHFVDFHGQDTLFLYSTVILNNSMSLR